MILFRFARLAKVGLALDSWDILTKLSFCALILQDGSQRTNVIFLRFGVLSKQFVF